MGRLTAVLKRRAPLLSPQRVARAPGPAVACRPCGRWSTGRTWLTGWPRPRSEHRRCAFASVRRAEREACGRPVWGFFGVVVGAVVCCTRRRGKNGIVSGRAKVQCKDRQRWNLTAPPTLTSTSACEPHDPGTLQKHTSRHTHTDKHTHGQRSSAVQRAAAAVWQRRLVGVEAAACHLKHGRPA